MPAVVTVSQNYIFRDHQTGDQKTATSSEGRLDFFKGSAFGLRDQESDKRNDTGAHQRVDGEGSC